MNSSINVEYRKVKEKEEEEEERLQSLEQAHSFTHSTPLSLSYILLYTTMLMQTNALATASFEEILDDLST